MNNHQASKNQRIADLELRLEALRGRTINCEERLRTVEVAFSKGLFGSQAKVSGTRVSLSEAGNYVADQNPPARANCQKVSPKYTGPVQPSEVHAVIDSFEELGLCIEGYFSHETIRTTLERRYRERGLL